MKKRFFEHFVGSFGFNFGHTAFTEGPGKPYLNEKGGWYDRLK